MQRYLTQLQTDIDLVIASVPKFSEYAGSFMFRDSDDEKDGFSNIRYLKLNELFNFQAQAFPPVELLNKPQLTELLRKIENLWGAFHIRYEFPYGLKARKRYTSMTDFMASETIAYSFDEGAEVDFCKDIKNCPFGDTGKCECRRIISELDDDIWVSNHPELFMAEEDPTDIQSIIRAWLDPDEELFSWELDGFARNPFSDKNEPLEYLYFFQKEDADPFYDDDAEEEFNPKHKSDEVNDDYTDFSWGDEYNDSLPF